MNVQRRYFSYRPIVYPNRVAGKSLLIYSLNEEKGLIENGEIYHTLKLGSQASY